MVLVVQKVLGEVILAIFLRDLRRKPVAKIILDYAEDSFERSPILRQLIVGRTADALECVSAPNRDPL